MEQLKITVDKGTQTIQRYYKKRTSKPLQIKKPPVYILSFD